MHAETLLPAPFHAGAASPWVVPKPYNAIYDPADMTAWACADTTQSEAAQHPIMDHWLGRRSEAIFTGGKGLVADMTELDQRQARATYCGLALEVDANLGRILTFLETSDQIDNSLIIITLDHGEQLGDHRLFGKLGWFDQSYHIPLIIPASGTPEDQQGTVVERFTVAIDIMLTILDWIGLASTFQPNATAVLRHPF